MSTVKHQIVIIGGGTGGIMTAAQLKRAKKDLDIVIIDPTKTHAYQPAWTLVGAGLMKMDQTLKKEKGLIPSGVGWIQDKVKDIKADENQVILDSDDIVNYDYLIVAPGIQINLDGVKGLKEAFGKNGVCSNYVNPEYTNEVLSNFKGGTALFTQPTTPIKCPGAPQKIMYLTADILASKGLKDKSNVVFATNGSMIFGVQPFKDELEKYLVKYDIKQRYGYQLVEVDGKNKEAHYVRGVLPEGSKYVANDDNNAIGERIENSDGSEHYIIKYDMLHLAPPQSAPTWFQSTKLANPDGPNKGWMAVDAQSLQSRFYPNVFGVGDVTDLPTARTGAAIRKQAPVVVKNILNLLSGKPADHKDYKGYSSCPLVVSHNKMLLAEFGYDGVRMSDPMLSTFFNTGHASYPMWLLKRYGLPFMYWNMMLKGYNF
jgi:sulfide:quinone oxidoreductase